MTQDTEIGLLNDLYEDLEKNNFDISLHTESKFNRIVSALKGIPRAMNKIYQSEEEIKKEGVDSKDIQRDVKIIIPEGFDVFGKEPLK